MGVELEGADGPHLVDGFFNTMAQGTGLVMAVHEDEDFLGVHDGTDTDREGCLRNEIHVIVEEAAVGDDGVGGKGLLAGAAGEAGAGLVEGDVAVGADAAHEEVDAGGGGDGLFIIGALDFEVGGVAVQNMDVLLLDVDVAEEVIPHEGVVAFGMVFRQVDVLIHVEGDYVLEGDFAGLVQGDQFAVQAQGGAAGRAAQFEGFLGRGFGLVDSLGYVVRSPLGHFVVVRFND